MVTLVEQMLAFHKQKADVKTDHEKTLTKRQIEVTDERIRIMKKVMSAIATDRQIDALVYELYGLTEEEIRIVEGVVK
jgi:hypothetical protein